MMIIQLQLLLVVLLCTTNNVISAKKLSPFFDFRTKASTTLTIEQTQAEQKNNGERQGTQRRRQRSLSSSDGISAEEYEDFEDFYEEEEKYNKDEKKIEAETISTSLTQDQRRRSNLRSHRQQRKAKKEEEEADDQQERELGSRQYGNHYGHYGSSSGRSNNGQRKNNNNNRNSYPEDYYLCESFYAKAYKKYDKKTKKSKKKSKNNYYYPKKYVKTDDWYYYRKCHNNRADNDLSDEDYSYGGVGNDQHQNQQHHVEGKIDGTPKPIEAPTPSPQQHVMPPSPHLPKDFIRFIMIREEAGTTAEEDFGIGDTLALNGDVYYWDDYEDGLISNDVVGSFVTLCTGINNADDLMCKYEIVLGGNLSSQMMTEAASTSTGRKTEELEEGGEKGGGIGAFLAEGPNYQSENYMIITGTEFAFAGYTGGTLVTQEDLVNPYLYADLYLF